MRLFLWDESKHMQGRGLDKYVISVYRLWQIVTYLMLACNTDVLQVYISNMLQVHYKSVLQASSSYKNSAPPERRLLSQSLTEWIGLAPSNILALRQLWPNIQISWKRRKKFRQVWSYLHSSGSIWLPRNGGLKNRDGSLDTRMRSELWLRRGSS